jgi:hypothetical protein
LYFLLSRARSTNPGQTQRQLFHFPFLFTTSPTKIFESVKAHSQRAIKASIPQKHRKVRPTKRKEIMTMNNKISAPEAIFIPIDLEASLGRIEDIEGDDCAQDMDCDEPSLALPRRTRTRNSALGDNHVLISPCHQEDDNDKMTGTTDVGDDNKVVSEVPTDFAKVSDWRSSFDLDLVPNDDDESACDDFSLTSHEAGSLVDEELEKISEDPASFWEEPWVPSPNVGTSKSV